MNCRVALLCLMLLLTGCASSGGGGSALIPDKSILLTSKLSIPLSSVAAVAIVGAVAYLVFDPLAPNWEISESRLSEDTFRLDLRMKRYHTGGAGESMQVLRRRADQLQHQLGYSSYELLAYSEGIESQTLGARRYAEGTIRLIQPRTAPLARNE